MANESFEADVRAAKRDMVGRFLQAPPTAVAAALGGSRRGTTSPQPSDNIVGLGVAEKVVVNRLTGELCVKVYVRRKLPEAEVSTPDRIPKTIAGIPTDIEEVGLIEALLQPCSTDRQRRHEPSPCGISVGHVGISAGTIGALVRDRGRADNGRRYILSNNHVLANSNASQPGDVIFQPGPLDGGTPDQHRVGRLTRFVPIRFGSGDENKVDCAIAEVSADAVLGDICSIGPIAGTVRPARDMAVWKHGRTTGLTRGLITDVDADIRVDFREAGAALFIDTVVVRGLPPTTPFSDGGDSGSVIVDRPQNRACALLFAGANNADVTFANPIQTVLSRLRVCLL
jgi:hypothetical protein